MKKWEYKIVESKNLTGGGAFKGKDREVVEVYLNQLGEAGWEIVALNFKEIQKGIEFTGVAKREVTA